MTFVTHMSLSIKTINQKEKNPPKKNNKTF